MKAVHKARGRVAGKLVPLRPSAREGPRERRLPEAQPGSAPPNGPPRPRSAPGPPRPGPQTAPGGGANGSAERGSGLGACRDFPPKAGRTGTRSLGGAGGCSRGSGWRPPGAWCSEGRSSPARRARKLGPSLRTARGQGAGGGAPGRPYRLVPGRSAGAGALALRIGAVGLRGPVALPPRLCRDLDAPWAW